MHLSPAKGLAVVLSAPSGGGKSSLVEGLLKLDNNFQKSISCTTRAPRPGEVEGQHYYFKSKGEFQRLIAEKQLLEFTEIYGNLYGTLKNTVEDALNKGIDILFDIEWRGAQMIKNQISEAVSIFIMPPSLEELKQRLIARNQDDPEVIERRATEAQLEMSYARDYDYVVINDDFDRALKEIYTIILSAKERNNR